MPDETKEQIRTCTYYQNQYGERVEEYLDSVSSAICNAKWDRVYITTLFTYEWDKTIDLIKYAQTLVSDPSQVIVGGIAATLMPKELEEEAGIRPMRGLIEDSAQLGYEPGVCIDSLIPDYSILEHIPYRYPAANGYFLTATRGCGNRCSFCAVQTLEPNYIDYIPLLPRIEAIRQLYGEKKNLYLLDNNVLKSSCFPQIIEDIKAAGFSLGATWLNPDSGKPNKRFVDFNQGLDAKFLTEDHARQLGEIALDPAHIAFDHIDEKERFEKAVRLMDKYDIRNVSSYLLYNTKSFAGKGERRGADTPHDLYERMRTSYNLNTEINGRRKTEKNLQFDCFAFPMRFIPLKHKNRTFIGDNWTRKLLVGVRTMLQPSHGGVFSTPDYFRYMYGDSYEEFYEILLMPNEYVRHKGKPADKYPDGIHPNKKWMLCLEEWIKLYRSLLTHEKGEFEAAIADNAYSADAFLKIDSRKIQTLYLHYLTGKAMTGFMELIQGTTAEKWVRDYIMYECPSILWCSLEEYGKLKHGAEKMQLLLKLLFSNTPVKTSEREAV